MASRAHLETRLLIATFALLVGACAAETSAPDELTSDERADAVGTEATPAAGAVPDALRRLMPGFYDTETVFREDGIAVVRSPVGSIFLRTAEGESGCANALRARDGLVALRQRLEPSFALGSGATPARLPSGWCELKLDAILPPYLAQTLGKAIDDNAMQSNCWGHSAAVVGAVTGVKELREGAFNFWMRSPMCRRLSATETPRAGDVVAIRSVEELERAEGDANEEAPPDFRYREVHTAVWITQELWAQKIGAGFFEINTPRAAYATYFSPDTPAHCRGRSPDELTPEYLRSCETLVDVYSCESVESHATRLTSRATFDAERRRLEPVLWETVHQQRRAEGDDDGVVARGAAYISRSAFSPVREHFFVRGARVPRAIQIALTNMSASRSPLAPTYPLDRPAVPALPSPLACIPEERADDDGECDFYTALRQHYRAAVRPLFRALAASRDDRERMLLTMLALEAMGSQLAPTLPEEAGSGDRIESPEVTTQRAIMALLDSQAWRLTDR